MDEEGGAAVSTDGPGLKTEHGILLPDWEVEDEHAVARVESWTHFVALLDVHFLDWGEYLFRGQHDSVWPLRSKFDRDYRAAVEHLERSDPLEGLRDEDRGLVEQMNPTLRLHPRDQMLARHLKRFKDACTGRRGTNPPKLRDDEWWALGQHFGLATPLLDWTRSPYVATYFALEKPMPSDSGSRAVWAFSYAGFWELFANQQAFEEESVRPPIEIVESLVDENARLLSQRGLFTRTSGDDVEEAIAAHVMLIGFSPVLYRIDIPDSEREAFLRQLEAMNIHAGSLFPDISGATVFANRAMEKESSDQLWAARPDRIRRMLANDSSHE